MHWLWLDVLEEESKQSEHNPRIKRYLSTPLSPTFMLSFHLDTWLTPSLTSGYIWLVVHSRLVPKQMELALWYHLHQPWRLDWCQRDDAGLRRWHEGWWWWYSPSWWWERFWRSVSTWRCSKCELSRLLDWDVQSIVNGSASGVENPGGMIGLNRDENEWALLTMLCFSKF